MLVSAIVIGSRGAHRAPVRQFPASSGSCDSEGREPMAELGTHVISGDPDWLPEMTILPVVILSLSNLTHNPPTIYPQSILDYSVISPRIAS